MNPRNPRDIKHSQDQEPGGIEVTLDVQDEDTWPTTKLMAHQGVDEIVLYIGVLHEIDRHYPICAKPHLCGKKRLNQESGSLGIVVETRDPWA